MKSHLLFLIRLRSQWRRNDLEKGPGATQVPCQAVSQVKVESWNAERFPVEVRPVCRPPRPAPREWKKPVLVPLFLVALFATSSALALTIQRPSAGNIPGSVLPPNLSIVPPSSGPPEDNGSARANSPVAFLRVVTLKSKFYIGEIVPVKIKAYFRAGLGATLNGLPTLSSDAFTLNKLSEKPEETAEILDGTPYTVLTWSSALAGVKAGDYSLGLDLPVLVQVREKLPARNPFRSMLPKSMLNNPFFDQSFFNDSFFDDFFSGLSEKPLTLKAEPSKLSILPLPLANRPTDFAGAIGHFEVSGEAAPTDCTVGDPITLQVKVSGSGNFDRVAMAGLPSSSAWKTYKAGAKFAPADASGCKGTKTFEQAVVPLKAGAEQIPAIPFSYFDPDHKKYVTLATAPIQVNVAAAATVASSPSTASPTPSAAVPPLRANQRFAADKIESGSFVRSLRPVFLSPGFIALQGLIAGGLVVVLATIRLLERWAKDPMLLRIQAADQAVRDCLEKMDQSLQTGDRSVFFQAARRALQERLGALWDIPASAVTPSEIDHHLNGSGRQINTLFQLADRAVYAGIQCDSTPLEHWKKFVTDQLKLLEAI